ncbi:hypothetical protein FSARC_1103 [Fusarium sarcochroum]|uniref:Uncharacterized protein n=1 Tax=Fusarium sarcochroum TaxID=1208366 RepID=A0A8H4UA60_9HYPO|nr:hypothetical protein FSARC_1103 [Fusarium sarcochroum]
MALAVTDPFNKLSPELRLQVLISTHSKSSISRMIQASPIMLQQYLTHKRYIIRQVIAAEFDEEMIQDAMAIILLPSPRGTGVRPLRKRRAGPMCEHLLAWSKSQLPDPLKDNDDHLLSQLNKLHSQLLLLIEDYITKSTASFPPREYLCLPQIQRLSTEGRLMFKGVKVTPRFNSANLTSLERKRFVKAFLVYELLCKTSNVHDGPSNLRYREVSNAEYEAVGCVHNYVCSLYGAIFAQCKGACLPSTSSGASLETGLLFPDTFYVDANAYEPNLGLFGNLHHHDIAASLSTLGLDHLTDFLRYDMAKPDEKEALEVQIQDVWFSEAPYWSFKWAINFMLWLTTKRKYKNGCESAMYKQLSLNPDEKLRYKMVSSVLGYSLITVAFTPKRALNDQISHRKGSWLKKPLSKLLLKVGFITRKRRGFCHDHNSGPVLGSSKNN